MNQNVETFPAPWLLKGYGYIVMFKAEPDWLLKNGFINADMADKYVPSVGTVMFVNYKESDAGPYGELLFIPGKFTFPEGERYSISKIYVSSMESVVNGQNNWGIPKELANFEFNTDKDSKGNSVEHIRITLPEEQGGDVIADCSIKTKSWGMPVTTALIPKKMRTVAQYWQDKLFYTSPQAKSKLKLSSFETAEFNQSHFPDLNGVKILGVCKADNMQMQFPVAE